MEDKIKDFIESGLIEGEDQHYEDALKSLKSALTLAIEVKSEYWEAESKECIAEIYFNQAEAYAERGEKDEASKYYRWALDLLKSVDKLRKNKPDQLIDRIRVLKKLEFCFNQILAKYDIDYGKNEFKKDFEELDEFERSAMEKDKIKVLSEPYFILFIKMALFSNNFKEYYIEFLRNYSDFERNSINLLILPEILKLFDEMNSYKDDIIAIQKNTIVKYRKKETGENQAGEIQKTGKNIFSSVIDLVVETSHRIIYVKTLQFEEFAYYYKDIIEDLVIEPNKLIIIVIVSEKDRSEIFRIREKIRFKYGENIDVIPVTDEILQLIIERAYSPFIRKYYKQLRINWEFGNKNILGFEHYGDKKYEILKFYFLNPLVIRINPREPSIGGKGKDEKFKKFLEKKFRFPRRINPALWVTHVIYHENLQNPEINFLSQITETIYSIITSQNFFPINEIKKIPLEISLDFPFFFENCWEFIGVNVEDSLYNQFPIGRSLNIRPNAVERFGNLVNKKKSEIIPEIERNFYPSLRNPPRLLIIAVSKTDVKNENGKPLNKLLSVEKELLEILKLCKEYSLDFQVLCDSSFIKDFGKLCRTNNVNISELPSDLIHNCIENSLNGLKEIIKISRGQPFNLIHYSGHSWERGFILKDREVDINLKPFDELIQYNDILFTFFNSCHAGLTSAESATLATQFLSKGSYFLAPVREVDDDQAYIFMREFYRKLFEGCQIGDAIRMARDPLNNFTTKYSYIYWGDPSLQLTFRDVKIHSPKPLGNY